MASKLEFLLAIILSLTVFVNGLAVHGIGQRDPHAAPLSRAAEDEIVLPPVDELFGAMNAYNFLSPPKERNANYWKNNAADDIRKRKSPLNMKKAKNIIMFLGDGMSLTTQTAARILQGQREGRPGEEELLSFEKFPYSGLSKTYCANAQVPDSACTATAYLCGVKTNMFSIGVTAATTFNNCSDAMNPANHVSSIAAWAQAAGKSTGFITTTTLTHASPSGSYAHITNRFWESDADIRMFGQDPTGCMDIATQLVTQAPGRYFDVMLGGGMGKFMPDTKRDSHGNLGIRQDGKNLISQWQVRHTGGVVVTNRDQLLAVNASANLPHSLMGVFQSGVMNFRLESDPAYQPTLTEMTEVALKMLQRNKKGYFIFIEGGLIDYGNHFNQPGYSLDETIELSKAVQFARDHTDPDETLIVVTADHAHPLSISGYPGRGNDILGLNEIDRDANGIKYPTLGYSVGSKQYLDENGQRLDLEGKFGSPSFVFPSSVKSHIGVHAGDDVGIFASGPHSHLFTGSMEQSSIPHLMAYAACIGDGPTVCNS